MSNENEKTGLLGVKNIIAVSSCKGGVGKSTVAVNLAFSLSQAGSKVGLFDADIYGPSLPTMVKLPSHYIHLEENRMTALEYEGVKLMSFGYTQQGEQPAMLRGPIISQVINQLLTQTDWGELDILVIDLPPGTGDVQITLCQILPLTAAVIVTTPQDISTIDVVKGIRMFDELNVPTIAIVENMSYFVCSNCDEKHELFGKGSLDKLSREFGFEHTFKLPLEKSLAATSDVGLPFCLDRPEAPISQTFNALAKAVYTEIDHLSKGPDATPQVEFDSRGFVYVSDGDELFIHPQALRKACQCAHCRDEFTGTAFSSLENVPETVVPQNFSPVGNYAVGVNWSDGHSSLYPYALVHSLGQKDPFKLAITVEMV